MFLSVTMRPQSLADRRFGPDEARDLLGQALTDHVPPELFGHQANRRPLQPREIRPGVVEPPPFFFTGGRGQIGISALGPDAVATLQDLLPVIYWRTAEAFGATPLPRRVSGHVDIARSYPHMYHIHRLIFARDEQGLVRALGPRRGGALFDTGLAEAAPAIQQAITSGLVSQAAFLDRIYRESTGMPGTLSRQLGTSSPQVDVLRGKVEVIAVMRGVIAAVAKNLTVSMPLDVKGPWLAGHFRSYGTGLITRRQYARQQVAA